VAEPSEHRGGIPHVEQRRERGLWWVVTLSAVTMIAEIGFGYTTRSMALLADGWHMATHVGALGLAALTHSLARRWASHGAFAFGTGKLSALSGYTSAIALGLVAVTMIVESVVRLFSHRSVNYEGALPVAIVGLLVNLAGVLLLHDHKDGGESAEHHDHNHRAALLHLVADALTSMLAIVALVVGRWLDLPALDAAAGAVGGCVILRWGFGLGVHAGRELVDSVPSPELKKEIQRTLEEISDVRVLDLRLWSLGGGRPACIVTLCSSCPAEPSRYHEALSAFEFHHLTIEVRRSLESH
jgi:cation diffusion facilitator family transporter